MRITTSLLLLLSFFALRCSQTPATSVPPPNVILIITDDQGYGDFGFMGNPLIETPNVDQLASESALMERFYVSPVCAPTRACLMTGRYNFRTRVVDTWVGRAQMDPEEITIAEILGQNGYQTGLFGKWHLGDMHPMRPQDQGFAEVLMHRGGGIAQPSEPIENARRYTDAILWHNGQQIQSEGYCTDVYFDYAEEFIRSSTRDKKPFFAYIATNAPHGPFHDVPEELRQKYMSKDLIPLVQGEVKDSAQAQDRLARIFAMIENVDQNIGELRATLKELAIEDNTLILFMVDNGPNSMRYVGSLRGMKTGIHDGGIRSPLLAHWPKQIKAGHRNDRISAHIDLLPTIVEAAGQRIPTGHNLDGKSILPLLTGPTPTDWAERHLFIQAQRGDVPSKRAHFAVIGQDYKLLHDTGFGNQRQPFEEVPYELYQVSSDPGEQNNLAESDPERTAAMLQMYDDWFADVSSTRPDNYAKPPIFLGTAAEPNAHLTWQDWEQITPGRGWGRQGRWYIDVKEPSTFAVEVIARDTISDWNVRLEIGTQTWDAQASGRKRRVMIPEVKLDKGPAVVMGYIDDGVDEVLGPYQLIFRKL
ncbi:MAG: arylsulfatase [Bacteroidota bacterium]